ncbi:hypothetical protein KVT40_003229 [Elsinoe batatas]|uniref:Uncharacterized protein n=1 Tax=Elsinoe batatas TaxID=2601811 RepID=A0A8K0L6F6_9PEZI|nr:hypothetical protein KVT40_003229 [Elsinoe batatas]
MYTVTDIPAFREQILANANFIYAKSKSTSWTGIGPQFEVVLSSVQEGSNFAASIVDINNNELYVTADIDANPAMAVFKLLTRMTDRLAVDLRNLEPREHTLATNVVQAPAKEA